MRSRIPVVVALGIGIVIAGAGALVRPVPPPWASLSRTVDDQRNAVAKPEVRDGVEEQDEQEDGSGALAGPALVEASQHRAVEAWSFFAPPASRLDAGRPRGRDRCIRGPPAHA